MSKEHESRLKELLDFAVNCSEYVSLSEAFSLPFKYRSILVECINKRVERMNNEMNN